MTEIQDISTAPKDGTRILGFVVDQKPEWGGWMTVAWCQTYKCWWSDPTEATEYDPEKRNVTHWIALPPDP